MMMGDGIGAIALVGFMESSSAAQLYAMKYGHKIDMNQELLAIVYCAIPLPTAHSHIM